MLAQGIFTSHSMSDRISNELNFYQRALGLRQQRQEVLSANIANADTPHYKARDFDFKAVMQGALGARMRLPETQLALTSARHIPGAAVAPAGVSELLYRQPLQPSLDGNTVDMDVERVQFADNTMRMQASMSLISQRIKTLTQAIQQ